DPAVAHDRPARRWELENSGEERVVAVFVEVAREKVIQHVLVDGARDAGSKEGADFRGKEEVLSLLRIVERLDAKPIARAKQLPLPLVPDREGVHADEPLQAGRPTARIRVQRDLRVRSGAEPHVPQLASQLSEVVDLAVVDDREPPVRGRHRLPTGIAQINDLEPPMPKNDSGARPEAIAVRPPVPLREHHPGHHGRIGTWADHPSNAAHQPGSRRSPNNHSASPRSKRATISTEPSSSITH